ncbi:unnamed protein product, partial [Tuber aestivum]
NTHLFSGRRLGTNSPNSSCSIASRTSLGLMVFRPRCFAWSFALS